MFGERKFCKSCFWCGRTRSGLIIVMRWRWGGEIYSLLCQPIALNFLVLVPCACKFREAKDHDLFNDEARITNRKSS